MRARVRRSVLLTAGLLAMGATFVGPAAAQPAPLGQSAGLPGDACNPPPPPHPTPPPEEDSVVGLAYPVDLCPTHNPPGVGSNDPNPNTNPDGSLAADTVTAPCGYGNPCSVTLQLADAAATITAQDTGAPRTSAAFSEASVPRGGPTLFATRDGGGAMPHCPGYTNTFTQWAQFGMRHADNGFRKTATFVLSHPGSAAAASAAARHMQICFEAPYAFQNRPGYQVAEHDGVFDGVLPDCSAFHDSAALPRPCVSNRGIVRHGSGWVARIQFRIPAGPQDPKALG